LPERGVDVVDDVLERLQFLIDDPERSLPGELRDLAAHLVLGDAGRVLGGDRYRKLIGVLAPDLAREVVLGKLEVERAGRIVADLSGGDDIVPDGDLRRRRVLEIRTELPLQRSLLYRLRQQGILGFNGDLAVDRSDAFYFPEGDAGKDHTNPRPQIF